MPPFFYAKRSGAVWPGSGRINDSRELLIQKLPPAPVAKLVDARDLKSLDLTVVPVRPRPGAPLHIGISRFVAVRGAFLGPQNEKDREHRKTDLPKSALYSDQCLRSLGTTLGLTEPHFGGAFVCLGEV